MTQKFLVLEPTYENDDSHASVGNFDMAWTGQECSVYATLKVKRKERLVVTPPIASCGDFIWTWYSDILMNTRAAEAFERFQITGYSAEPVTIRHSNDTAGTRTTSLQELRVTGFAGFADTRGGVDVLQGCPECGAYTFRFRSPFWTLVNEEKWDGSDLFTVWPFPGIVLCTEQVLLAIERFELTGITVIPIEEFELAPNRSGGASPGIPSASLDESAVRRLLDDRDYLETLLD
jgi:hypothetical protein